MINELDRGTDAVPARAARPPAPAAPARHLAGRGRRAGVSPWPALRLALALGAAATAGAAHSGPSSEQLPAAAGPEARGHGHAEHGGHGHAGPGGHGHSEAGGDGPAGAGGHSHGPSGGRSHGGGAMTGRPEAGVAREIPVAEAAEIYHQYCSVCHGDRGDGDSRARGSLVPPPRDFTSPEAALELDRGRMIASVAAGRPGTAMAGWAGQLTGPQIAAVVDFIRERFMRVGDAERLARGRRIYDEHCSVCHGDRGDGESHAASSLFPRPRDFTTDRAAAELDRDRMIFSVTYGRANTAMPSWSAQLAPEDIEAVVDYVRATFMRPLPVAAASGTRSHGSAPGAAAGDHAAHGHRHQVSLDQDFMAAPFPGGVAGDPRRGAELYRQNCTACHGDRGDGRGPRAYFILPKPRDFRHIAARKSLNRPHLLEAIAAGSVGTVMPAWRTVLSPQQLADVAEYVYQRFIAARGSAEADAAR